VSPKQLVRMLPQGWSVSGTPLGPSWAAVLGVLRVLGVLGVLGVLIATSETE